MVKGSSRKIKKSTLYGIIAIAFVLGMVTGAYAWVVADPPLPVPDPGHALDTIQGYFVGDASLRDTLAKLQQRPAAGMSCPSGSIKTIDVQGSVTCEPDDIGLGPPVYTSSQWISFGGCGLFTHNFGTSNYLLYFESLVLGMDNFRPYPSDATATKSPNSVTICNQSTTRAAVLYNVRAWRW